MAYQARLLGGEAEASSIAGAWVGSFLQTDFWAAFKEGSAWKALRFVIASEPGHEGKRAFMPLLVLLRRLPLGLSFAYVPHGPLLGRGGAASSFSDLCMDEDPDARIDALERGIEGMAVAIKPFLPRACLFIRWDPPQYCSGGIAPPQFGRRRLRKARLDVQVPDSVVLDLSLPEEGILAGMKPKWRYNVRLAEKKGVRVDCLGKGDGPALEEGVAAFYRLYLQTAERDGIAVHPESYYRRLFALADARADGPDVRLYLARAQGRDLAGIVTLFRGEEAVYLYGASANEGRELMPAYALQWAAIRDARASGCLRYDFFGIPPSDDPGHPMHGLYRFKTGFGGKAIHRPGSWDSRLGGPVRNTLYGLYRAAEWLRWFAHKRLAKAIASAARGAKRPQPGSENTSASKTKTSV